MPQTRVFWLFGMDRNVHSRFNIALFQDGRMLVYKRDQINVDRFCAKCLLIYDRRFLFNWCCKIYYIKETFLCSFMLSRILIVWENIRDLDTSYMLKTLHVFRSLTIFRLWFKNYLYIKYLTNKPLKNYVNTSSFKITI